MVVSDQTHRNMMVKDSFRISVLFYWVGLMGIVAGDHFIVGCLTGESYLVV